ncbi:MAG: hypothetical protein IT314_13435 [Anaerolineales bacterium]|nr:hypothetical protein [Anaerolineales bacterium]
MNIDFDLHFLSFRRKVSLDKRAVRYLVIVATLLAAVVVAFWGTELVFLAMFAGGVGLVGFLVLMRQLKFGYFAILLGGMFLPFAGPGGFNASILMVILICALWLLDMLIVKKEFRFVTSRAIRPAIYMLAVCIVAFGLGQIPWFAFGQQAPFDAQLGGFAIYFFSIATMIMTANLITDAKWLQAIMWTFVGLGAVYVFGNALNLKAVDAIYQEGIYANSMFWMWMIAVTLGQALFNDELGRRNRILVSVVFAATFFVAFFQQNDWKSGWVPAVVAAMVLVVLRYPKLILLGIPVALVYGGIVAQELISTDQYSWDTRIDAWLVVLEISKASPLFGLGFANYYWYAPLFSLRGYYIQFNSHSQYVDLIAQTGIAGLVCFVWILIEVGWLAWLLKDRIRDGFSRGYVYSMAAGVAGVFVAAFLVDWVLPFAYNIGLEGFRASILPWIFFGGLISLEQIHRSGKSL